MLVKLAAQSARRFFQPLSAANTNAPSSSAAPATQMLTQSVRHFFSPLIKLFATPPCTVLQDTLTTLILPGKNTIRFTAAHTRTYLDQHHDTITDAVIGALNVQPHQTLKDYQRLARLMSQTQKESFWIPLAPHIMGALHSLSSNLTTRDVGDLLGDVMPDVIRQDMICQSVRHAFTAAHNGTPELITAEIAKLSCLDLSEDDPVLALAAHDATSYLYRFDLPVNDRRCEVLHVVCAENAGRLTAVFADCNIGRLRTTLREAEAHNEHPPLSADAYDHMVQQLTQIRPIGAWQGY